MKKFKLHWRCEPKEQIIEGDSIDDACRRAGIGAGALAVLDYWEEIHEPTWQKVDEALQLGSTTSPEDAPIETDQQKIVAALAIITRYGGIDGAHHKQWTLDQVVRALTGGAYRHWVRGYQKGDEGPNTYEWETGIAP